MMADLQLDEGKLAAAVGSEQGEVFVLQWLSKVESTLKGLEQSELLSSQAKLEACLLRLICPLDLQQTSDNPAMAAQASYATVPKPGRPTRQLIARCFVHLFERGETKTLYDVVRSLQQIAGDDVKGKPIPEKESKAAALYVAGQLFLSSGQYVMSQFVGLITLTQKIGKNALLPVLVRYQALSCLSKVLRAGARSLNEQSGKDLVKMLRQTLLDRAGAVARAAADCLYVLLQETTLLSSRAEVEALLAACFKAIDTADFVTMRGLSKLASALLAHTQRESAPPPASAPKKKSSKKKGQEGQEDSSDDEVGPSTQGAQGADGGHRTIMNPKTMLGQLSAAFLRPALSQRGRSAILDVYASTLEMLGAGWVQTHYEDLIYNLLDEIPNHARGTSPRAEILTIRSGVSTVLRQIVGERMLDETAQVGAIQELCTAYLKRWPVLTPGQHPPSKYSLALAFDETSGLLAQLGCAPPQVIDALEQPLLRCIAHPSHSVQMSAAWCLKQLCTINPSQLTPMLESVMTDFKRDLTALQGSGERGGADLPKRTTGRARGLAALISIIQKKPLYVSFAISGQVLELAIGLLKSGAEHSLSISAVEIQVAWTLIGALMSLGPNFVRDHLNQFLNMWRSALPKLGEGATIRSDAEWAFLLHVRECTLGSIYAFLNINAASLVTLDTARRLIAMLSNSLSFVNQFAAQHPTLSQDQVVGSERSTLTLLDREHMVRRRIMQCFTILAHNPAMDALQENLIQVSLQSIAEPDRYIGSAAQASIAASAGNFVSIWQISDGYAYGVCSLIRDAECSIASHETSSTSQNNLLNRDEIESRIDALQRRPIIGALEHDPTFLYTHSVQNSNNADRALPVPPTTAAVDAAVELFAALLPFQKREVQIASAERLLSYVRSSKLDKNPARRMAIQVNACVAVLGALRITQQPVSGARHPSGFNNDRFITTLRELLLECLTQGDLSLRYAASEAFGRLAAVSGSQAMSAQVQILVDQVVSNRNPDARAGCALAFGSIYQEVGGLSAGPLTKTVVDILMSLAGDPHPTVHFTALEALRMVVEAASLSYSPYISSTLGVLVKLYMLSTHEPEGGSAGSANLRADLPATQSICRVINALIGVQGPDLRDSTKIRTLILILLNELSNDSEEGVIVEATKATQHLTLFASEHVDLIQWMSDLQARLKNKNKPLRAAAINGFYQLIQRQALLVSKTCGNALVEEFFALLDSDTDADGVRQLLRNWLRQTADLNPCSWIDLCQRVSKSAGGSGIAGGSVGNGAQQQSNKPIGTVNSNALQDEEAAAIDLGDESGKGARTRQSRWRTQLFALECLHDVFVAVRKSGKIEHFGTPKHQTQLSSRVGDLIRMAFTASTSLNQEIRLEGLTILRDVVENFKTARDPDFDEALLLEQHQAPIAAALTPAFLSDSTPEVLARAIQVCAVFVGSGVVKEMDKLGRILRLLTRALERCLEPQMTKMGDVENLSPNAGAMLKIAVFSAWAQLQVASIKQTYLNDILRPHSRHLATVWVRSLAEYANLRADPEGTGMPMAPMVNDILDTPYAGLIRAVLVPHHQRAWPTILHAIAVLMGKKSGYIDAAMRGEEVAEAQQDLQVSDADSTSFRSEPVLYFYPLYGLSFEALATGSGSTKESQGVRTTLLALRYLCNARYAGSVLLQEDMFEEMINLMFRVIMTEAANVQVRAVEMVAAFVRSYGVRLSDQMSNGATAVAGGLLPETKLTTCLRLLLAAQQNARSKPTLANSSTEDCVALIRASISAFCLTVSQFEAERQREYLFVIGFYAYFELLDDETSGSDLVGPTLASLKELCQASMEVYGDALQRCIHGLLSANLNTLDNMRTRSGIAAINKTKNALLSTVVILTSLSKDVSVSQNVLEQYCYLLGHRLRPDPSQEGGVTVAFTAINCIKTILLSASRRGGEMTATLHPSIAFCIGQMLIQLTEVLQTAYSQSIQGPAWLAEATNARVTEEALKTLTGFAGVVQDETYRARVMAVILPVLAMFLDAEKATWISEEKADEDELVRRATSVVGHIRSLTVNQILALARQSVQAFRAVAEALPAEARTRVELSLRNAAAITEGASNVEQPTRNEAKTIELKMFG